MLLTRERNVGGNVKEEKVGDAVDAGNHAVDDEQIPPRAPPALLEDGDALAVEGGKGSSVEVDFQGEPLHVVEHLASLVLLAAAVEADDKQHHGLDKEAISGPLWVVDETAGFFEQVVADRGVTSMYMEPTHRMAASKGSMLTLLAMRRRCWRGRTKGCEAKKWW